MRALLTAFIAFLVFFLTPKIAHAVSISIESPPDQVTDSEFSIKFVVRGAKAATNYFRVLLSQEGSQSFVVETWNGNSWYSAGNGTQYLPISVTSGETKGEMKARLKPGVKEGEYILSIRRYTASGNAANDEAPSIKVRVTIPQKETSPPATASPLPTPTPEKTENPIPPATTSSEDPPVDSISDMVGDVLSTDTEETEHFSPSENKAATPLEKQIYPQEEKGSTWEAIRSILVVAMSAGGMSCVGIGVFLFVRDYKDWYTERTDI